MTDQDSGDCKKVKDSFKEKCNSGGRQDAIVRIACHELESFFLGDLLAIENGLGVKDLSGHQNQSKFRNPDRLERPSKEIEMLIKNKQNKLHILKLMAPGELRQI
jgi:hypothetical protein